MPGKGPSSSNKKKATARGRAAEKSASGGRTPASAKQMSQGRFPGERPLTGEDRPSNRKGGKVQGLSAKPRGRGRESDEKAANAARRPKTGMAQPAATGRHPV
jgi:hypothetical protein